MNKIYKINGKKIKIDPITINPILLQLLEALSDKEENKSCEECNLFYTSSNDKICKSCKDDVKQSTSLEGEIERIIGLHTHEDRIDKTDIAEDVLSLLQSHLVKEIESKKIKNDIEPKGGNWSTQDVINLQNTLIENIIKIINNIK